MKKKLAAALAIAAMPLTMASTCSASSDGHTPSSVHTTNTTPPIPVYDSVVLTRFKSGGGYWLTVKDKNVGSLTFRVSSATYAKCAPRAHYPACER